MNTTTAQIIHAAIETLKEAAASAVDDRVAVKFMQDAANVKTLNLDGVAVMQSGNVLLSAAVVEELQGILSDICALHREGDGAAAIGDRAAALLTLLKGM